ncbi:MAG: hypothetical protein OXG37_05800 [Actinomycetia bacterium]|nr:hypothetical protein [Actinomycetes bacterium]
MEAKSDSECRQALAMAVGDLVAQGCRVEWHADLQAVLVHGRRPSHLLHLILTLMTALWALVWLAVTLLGSERQEMVTVDEWGNICMAPVQESGLSWAVVIIAIGLIAAILVFFLAPRW